MPQDCPLDLAGALTVGCEATGLAAELALRPFRGGAVQGAVGVLSGKGERRLEAALEAPLGRHAASKPVISCEPPLQPVS